MLKVLLRITGLLVVCALASVALARGIEAAGFGQVLDAVGNRFVLMFVGIIGAALLASLVFAGVTAWRVRGSKG